MSTEKDIDDFVVGNPTLTNCWRFHYRDITLKPNLDSRRCVSYGKQGRVMSNYMIECPLP